MSGTTTQTPALVHKAMPAYGVTSIDEDEGIVEAYVSGIGNKDSVNDIIVSGAFDESLKARKPKGVWSHNWDRPVSKTLEIREVKAGTKGLPEKMLNAGIGGLYVKTQFNLDTQDGRDAFSWVKFYGEESEWSIGYQIKESEFDKKQKALLLKEIDLFEYSPVLFGANPLTSTVGVKVAVDEDGNEQVLVKVEGADDAMNEKIEAAVKAVMEEEAKVSDEAPADDAVEDLDTKEAEGAAGDDEGAEPVVESEVKEAEPGDGEPTVEGEAEVPPAEESAATDVEPEGEGAEGAEGSEDAGEKAAPAAPELSQVVEYVKGMLSSTDLTLADSEELKSYIEDRTQYDEKIMVGSWAWISKKVRSALKDHHDRYVYIHSLFDSKVVYFIYDWSKDDDYETYYEASYTVSGDEVTLGDPVEVEVVEVVLAKNAVVDAAFKGHGEEVKGLLKPFVDMAVGAEVLDEDHQKALTEALEVKVGATLSKASKATLEAAVSDLESAVKSINSLLDTKSDEEEDEDLEEKTGEDVTPEGEVKTAEAKDDEASQEDADSAATTIDPADFAEMKSLLSL